MTIADKHLEEDVQRLTSSLAHMPEPMSRPVLVVVSGLPGTGKSYFCRRLAERMPFLILETDQLRRALFTTPSYSGAENQRLFAALHHLIARLLNKGIPTILDATNLSERNREFLYSIAERQGAKLILVRVEAPPEVVKQRLEARTRGNNAEDHSEADWRVYQRMRKEVQPIRRNHFAVDTSRDIAPVIEKVVKAVKR